MSSSMRNECAQALLDWCHRCFCTSALGLPSKFLSREFESPFVVPRVVEIGPNRHKGLHKHEKFITFKSDWDFTDITSMVSWFIGCVYFVVKPDRFPEYPFNMSKKLHLVKPLTEILVRERKIPKTEKNSKFSKSRFQNFEKIDLIILANRSNRSNRKKSQSIRSIYWSTDR